MKYLVLTLALVGCRTQPLLVPIDDETPILVADLGVPDLPPRTRDLATPGRIGCGTLNSCINQCDNDRCQQDCYRRGTQDAQDLYEEALQCLYNWCFDPQLGRSARCVQGVNGQPRDPPDIS